ncbi:Uracil-DNA glycosylase-like protein [Venturia nashicola]|uniref:Uracil-DNA glycosylase-like protein n=1 Tax=Venturia nashicola TaxID=86259 RepID=A0A4Z1PLC3_9PEZI|nr:Uracil-DNA glycosylase-like protein [Venturia nashicola]TLD38603.1 Uracil-DNA glycosylase-like protein [Venturia nashicola]
MAKTRSRTTDDEVEQPPSEPPYNHGEPLSNNDNNDLEEPTYDFQPLASFNGKLQQFRYSTVSSGTSVAPTNNRPSLVPGKTAGKRARKGTIDRDGNLISASPSPAKKRRPSSKYAPPEKYAHLAPLTDILEPGLICVFVGFNPGVKTATSGHAYAHPSNMFWKLLHSSGLTDRRCRPQEDVDLPRLYSMGNTNIVSRPSKDAAELSKEEVVAGTPILDAKMRKYKPEAVCIVGKSIWEAIWQYRHGRKPTKAQFSYGWQDEVHNMGKLRVEGEDDTDEDWPGAKVFVATSTSGLSAFPKPPAKEAIWKPFGEWVQKRRAERAKASADTSLES